MSINLLFIISMCSSLFSQSMNGGENKIGEIRSFNTKDLMTVETKNFENVIKNVPESKLLLSYYPTYKEVRIVLSCPYNKYELTFQSKDISYNLWYKNIENSK